MKTLHGAIAIAMFMAGSLFMGGCQSPTEKKQEAQEDLQEAREDLREAQKEVSDSIRREASAEEYQAFKTDAEVKIKRNEERIAELRVKHSKPGKVLDEYYESRISALEKRNRELREELNSYDMKRTDWDEFKREFNHDMDELGKAIEDLFTDNKK